ncbi:MAG: MBL fold metallo-hydrolase [Acidobacteriaceae bacterium]|nr:MBL fold metallo-hydrolase [Acidobacteriaceae bacterium]
MTASSPGGICPPAKAFSALVTGRCGSEERSVLFDVGPSAEVWLENARRLGVRLASSEAVCLSHCHADHSGGLSACHLEINQALRDSSVVGGNFGLTFDGPSRAARQLTAIYPAPGWLNLCYADSGIFVRRSTYDAHRRLSSACDL